MSKAVLLASLAYLEKHHDLRKVCRLGFGSFGVVYKMKDTRRNRDVAVKIVASTTYPRNPELELWLQIEHKHILPLIDVVLMHDLDTKAYVTPLLETTLFDTMYDVTFRRRRGSLARTKRWLYEVLKGMEYLIRNGMCHLDIKSDNVLISSDKIAMLCDFSFLNRTDGPIDRRKLGVPYQYRPPDVCRTKFPGPVEVEGEPFDSWGFGAMSVEVLTGFPISSSKGKEICWEEDIYPVFRDALLERTFFKNLGRTFPSDPLEEGDKRMALDFVLGFLMTNPNSRVKASDAKKHYFLNKGRRCFFKKDPVWTGSCMMSSNPIKLETLISDTGSPSSSDSSEKGSGKTWSLGRVRNAWDRFKNRAKRNDKEVQDNGIPDNEINTKFSSSDSAEDFASTSASSKNIRTTSNDVEEEDKNASSKTGKDLPGRKETMELADEVKTILNSLDAVGIEKAAVEDPSSEQSYQHLVENEVETLVNSLVERSSEEP